MIVWVADCATLDEGELTGNVEKTFLDFFESKLMWWNYTMGIPPAQDTNPLISHGNFSFGNLSAITNRVKDHMYTNSYCLESSRNNVGHQIRDTVMNATVVERDISAQEVTHILLDQPLAQSSRTIIRVDCRTPD
ncbi:hypothetical protein E4U45_005128 [Claviceps purpurea]|nr:hypothetical protein E4U45_005128 [Claviceps purpurea]